MSAREDRPPTAAEWATFYSMGDLNRDGYINQGDLDYFTQRYYGSHEGDSRYDSAFDYNLDGDIDIFDAVQFGQWINPNLGRNIWDYFNLVKPEPPMSVGIVIALILAAVVVLGVIIGRKK